MRSLWVAALLGLGACDAAGAGDRVLVGVVAGNELSCALYGRASDTDAGAADAGATDAGASDAGATDAGAAEPESSTARCWGGGQAPAPSPFGRIDGTLVLGDPSCVLGAAGRVRCVGRNDRGQLGNGRVSDEISDVPSAVVGLGPVRAVATSRHGFAGGFACAITDDEAGARVHCWGAGDRGQLGQGTEDRPTPQLVPGLRGVEAIALGSAHACAVVSDDAEARVYCWGAGDAGQLGNGTLDRGPAPVDTPTGERTLDRPAQLSAGARHTCALDAADGELWCWGANDQGQLGDGTLLGRAAPTPVDVSGLRDALGAEPVALAVSAGAQHTCALFEGGHVACWGSGARGQVGRLGAAVQAPRLVPLDAPAESVAAGPFHTCALSAGEVYCWGQGAQLGRGGALDSSRPQRVPL